MKKYIKDLLNFFYILNITASVTNANIITGIIDKTLSSCVVNIVKEESAHIFPLDLTLVNLNDDLIISSLHKVGGLKFTSRTFSFDSYRIYNSAYIIESESRKELNNGLSQVIGNGQWNPKARYIIILRNEKEYDLLHLGNWFFEHNIDDVFFITPRSSDHVVYKLNTTSNDFCHRFNEWAFVSSCSEYLTKKSLPVFRKHESIRNCKFKFITHNVWPFVNIDDISIEGIEQRILKEFEKYEKVKIELHAVMKQTDIHGVIIPGYMDNMLKKVQDNEFEGTVAGYDTFQKKFEYLSYTYPIIADHAVFVLAHAKYLGPWEFVIGYSCLPIGVLIVFIVLCILTSLLEMFPTQERDVTRDFLLVLGYILNKTYVRKIHPNFPQRLLFFSLLWLSLWLPYVINGQIYSTITKPNRGYEPKEVNELKEYTFILYSEFGREYPLIKRCDSLLNCLLEVKNDETKSLFTIMSDASLLAHRSKITDNQCNKIVYKVGDAFVELRTIFLRRGSCILDPFNKFMLRMVSAGFIKKYYDEISHLENLKCQYHQSPIQKINISDIYVLYIVLLTGYMISFIIFMLELILGARKEF